MIEFRSISKSAAIHHDELCFAAPRMAEYMMNRAKTLDQIINTIRANDSCSACGGSGVYVGMGERDGAAVVCYNCNGSGKYNYKFEYNEFTGIKKKKDVKRVYKSSYGYVISPEVIDFKDIGQIDMSKEGVSYEDFVKGIKPDHTKNLVCPMIAYQGACHEIEGFVDKCSKINGSSLLGMSLYKCKGQKNKRICWDRFDKVKG